MKVEVYKNIFEALKKGEMISASCCGVPKGWEISVSDCSVRDCVHDFITDLWSGGFFAGDDLEICFFLDRKKLKASYTTSPGWMAEMNFNAPSEEDYETYEEYEEAYELFRQEFVENNSGSGTIEFNIEEGKVIYE